MFVLLSKQSCRNLLESENIRAGHDTDKNHRLPKNLRIVQRCWGESRFWDRGRRFGQQGSTTGEEKRK